MLQLINVIIPVFAIMGLGFGAVRLKLFPAEGVKGLVVFVNNFATPCLLCQAMLTADFGATFNPAIILPFYVGALVSFAVGSFMSWRVFKRTPGEGVASGFSATFTNTVLLGVPLLQRAYGSSALPTGFSIIAFHAPTLITLGMLVMELVRRDGAPLHRAVLNAVRRMLENPLVWGVLAGVLLNAVRVPVPEAAHAFLQMMSAAVLPASLFGLGGALNQYRLSESWAEASVMSALKLISQPAIAYVLMVPVLHVPIEIARYGVLLAAMPAGINVYIFATYYDRSVSVAANTILISTVASLVTLTSWLAFLGGS